MTPFPIPEMTPINITLAKFVLKSLQVVQWWAPSMVLPWLDGVF